MRNSHIVLLINDSVSVVKCSYESGHQAPVYSFKTTIPDLAVGDLVVIPTDSRHKFTVVRVEETDVDWDYDSGVELKWIVDRVDIPAYQAILDYEQKAITAVQKAERRKKREELKSSVLADQAADLEALQIEAPSTDAD